MEFLGVMEVMLVVTGKDSGYDAGASGVAGVVAGWGKGKGVKSKVVLVITVDIHRVKSHGNGDV